MGGWSIGESIKEETGAISLSEIIFAEMGLIVCIFEFKVIKFRFSSLLKLLETSSDNLLRLSGTSPWGGHPCSLLEGTLYLMALEHFYDIVVFVEDHSLNPGIGEDTFFAEVMECACTDA